MAQQLEQWADEELQVRKPLPAEVNNVLSSLWSGLGSMGLALFALLPMIAHDWQRQGYLDWAGAATDWLGVAVAGCLALLFLAAAGVGTVLAAKQRPFGLTLTKVVASSVTAVAALLSLGVLVLIIQGQFSLGPTPILAGTLLVVIGLLPAFLGGLTLSLTTVDAVREFFYPPEEVITEAPVEEEAAAEALEAPISEEELERSLAELPTGESAAPAVSLPQEVIRAELGESRLIRAELDTEAAEVIHAELDEELLVRAELDEENLVRAELDEERLVHAEPASSVPSSAAGPASDIFQAELSPRSPQPIDEVDIERIGDTASRVLSHAPPVPESPSAILLSALTESPSSKSGISELLASQLPTPQESAPAVASQADQAAHEEASAPAGPQDAAVLAPEQSTDVFVPAMPQSSVEVGPAAQETPVPSEEIFSAPVSPAPRSETSAIDLQHLAELEFAAVEDQQPPIGELETPVCLPSGEPEIEGIETPPSDLSASSPGDLVQDTSEAAQGKVSNRIIGVPTLFPELSDISLDAPPEAGVSPLEQPYPSPPSDELFRDLENNASEPATNQSDSQSEPQPPHNPDPSRQEADSSENIFRIAEPPETEIRWEPGVDD